MDLITLRAGTAGLVLAPSAGGSVARYRVERGGATVDLLRPWSVPGAGDPFEAAAFPLVPYSNRIREGRFPFHGRPVRLPPNRPPNRHSIHGHGWQAAWRPILVRAGEAVLEYRHAPDAWPWAYRATQRFEPADAVMSCAASSPSSARTSPEQFQPVTDSSS